jgi:hypothetical protein
MEVKRMSSRHRVVAGAMTLICLSACSRREAAPKQPQSGFVAPSVCAGCHSEIAKTYRQTGMGRSFYRPTAANIVEDYGKSNWLYHRPSGRYYTMVERDGNWFQRRHQTGFDG